jgi:predicted kinase
MQANCSICVHTNTLLCINRDPSYMARLILVCGPTGVGKTTYSLSLSKEIGAIRFSIDPWMQTLFSKDMVSLDYAWMIERVNRCCEQIWHISEQVLALDGHVVLDLGFTTKAQREEFVGRAKKLDINPEVHYLDAPKEIRKGRIARRNAEKDPSVYSFEVTDMMFNFMESRFEAPDQDELVNGCRVNA